jgi:hypothetical protein
MVDQMEIVDDFVDKKAVGAQDNGIIPEDLGLSDEQLDILVQQRLPTSEIQSRVVGADFFKERDSRRGIELGLISGWVTVAAFEIAPFGHVIVGYQRAEAACMEPERCEVYQIIQKELGVRFLLNQHSHW